MGTCSQQDLPDQDGHEYKQKPFFWNKVKPVMPEISKSLTIQNYRTSHFVNKFRKNAQILIKM